MNRRGELALVAARALIYITFVLVLRGRFGASNYGFWLRLLVRVGWIPAVQAGLAAVRGRLATGPDTVPKTATVCSRFVGGVTYHLFAQVTSYLLIILGVSLRLIDDGFFYGTCILFGLVQFLGLLPLAISWRSQHKAKLAGAITASVVVLMLNIMLPLISPHDYI